VVVTGMGVVAANGEDLNTFWSSILAGKSAGKTITRFDVSNLPNKIAAEISDFDPLRYMDSKRSKRFDLSLQYGIAASSSAVKHSGLNVSEIDPDRIGVIEGTSVSGMESSFNGQTAFLTKGYRSMSPFTFINAYCGGGSGEMALELGIKGCAVSYSSGSASGNDAIGYAYNMVKSDEVDVMVAGGTEAPLLAPLYGAFCLTKVMTARNTTPHNAMRPFDRDRDGFLLGEGAAFVVLEELSHALARGAKIYAEILGHGRSCEAYHSVSPHPEGIGLTRAIQKALKNSHIHPEEVDYVNMHGTATVANDLTETISINQVFGKHARKLAVSSTKPVTGHLLAAAGAIETVVCVLSVSHQMLPQTANLENPADGCNLDYVASASRPYPIRVALNTNVGFGGKNSCLVIKGYS